MKLFIFIVFIALFNCVHSQIITITPYSDSSKCDTTTKPQGVGYQLPLEYCFSLLNATVSGYLQMNGNTLKAYWFEECSYPIDFNSAIQVDSYDLNSCSRFTVPNVSSFLSLFSKSSQVPSQAITTSYYTENASCSGPSYKFFITNGFLYQGSKYLCKNGKPFQYYCISYRCLYVPLSGCSSIWTYQFPYETTC